MRVLFVVNSSGAGGAEIHILNLAKLLIKNGHDVYVAALKKQISGGAKDLFREFKEIDILIRYLSIKNNFLSDIERINNLHKYIRELKPDIVHSHLPRSDIIVFLTQFLIKFKWVSTIHDSYVRGVYSGYFVIKTVGMFYLKAHSIIAVSNSSKFWIKKITKNYSTIINVIHHGIRVPNKNFYKIKHSLHRNFNTNSKKKLIVGTLARYESRKGLVSLIMSMKIIRQEFPNSKLLIAGSDPNNYSVFLKKIIINNNLQDSVELLDFQPKPLSFLKKIDVFCLPSEIEGFGIVLLEAMSIGLPIVATNIYPINFIINDKVSGLLVTPGNTFSLALSIMFFFRNRNIAINFGEAGFNRLRINFDELKMYKKTLKVYNSILPKFKNI